MLPDRAMDGLKLPFRVEADEDTVRTGNVRELLHDAITGLRVKAKRVAVGLPARNYDKSAGHQNTSQITNSSKSPYGNYTSRRNYCQQTITCSPLHWEAIQPFSFSNCLTALSAIIAAAAGTARLERASQVS